MECKRVPWPDSAIEKDSSIEDCGWPSRDYAYECKINLLTGRTHQVLQLSFCFLILLVFAYYKFDLSCSCESYMLEFPCPFFKMSFLYFDAE